MSASDLSPWDETMLGQRARAVMRAAADASGASP